MKLTIHRSLLLLLSAFCIPAVYAQSAYGLHKLEPGETLSAIAKSYHTTVGDIMRLNGMNAQSKLQPGEQIKVPADGAAVPAQKPAAKPVQEVMQAPAAGTPKTHVVVAGETLYRISQTYKIPIDQLKTLNNLQDGGVKVGQTILLTGDAMPAQPVKPKSEPVAAAQKETKVQEQPKENVPAPQPKETVSAPPVKQAPASSAPVVSQPPVVQSQTADVAKPEVIVQDNSNASDNNYSSSSNAPKEGFFTSQYGKDNKGHEEVKDGAAMTFKSASGWADKKYYILMNEAPAGSIVKIKNGRNELYAKVLWNLSEMKENEGLSFRISTAAAAALGITDQKFDLKVSYYE